MRSKQIENIHALQIQMSSGDEKAFKLLYDHYVERLFQFAFAIVHSRETAEEIIEDVFIQVWKKREKLKHIETFSLYLYVATKNISLNYLRSQRKATTIDLESVSLPQYTLYITPADIVITRETLNKINHAINDLPPKCKMIFKLVKEDGLKYREVAELLNISIKTVENQVGIALKKIHSAIDISFSRSNTSLL